MAALKGVKTLDMVGGEITKVSYEGAEYERVVGDAKIGDIIRLTEEARHDVTPGGFYTVRGVRGARVQITDDVNEPHHWDEDYYDLFRKKHRRLKVGDYAKVVEGSDLDEADAGDIVKIIHDDYDRVPFKCDVIKGRRDADYIWAEESDLVLATEAEVAEAKAPKFSVGDYAKVVGDTYHSDIVEGAIVKITDLADGEGDLRFELVGDDDYDYAKPSSLEKVSAEEAKWAKIGRKVDEYKVGDIVAYDDPQWFENKGIGEVTEATDEDNYAGVVATDNGGRRVKYYLLPEKLTLITPVEVRFDRS
ncbi:hypothetical protein [Bacillus safensis]|uniref:hypothetical protein n=1 Tax=Bacillus safensis TaxID=561879 RepID=UPI0020CFA94E|nr:hypothetical protein [Bacillus safensis]MCP9282995.1 hypothetical protein [Bacillus safensis]